MVYGILLVNLWWSGVVAQPPQPSMSEFVNSYPIPAADGRFPIKSPQPNLYKKCHQKGLYAVTEEDFMKQQACADLFISIAVLQDIIPIPEPAHFYAPPNNDKLLSDAIKICPKFRRMASSVVSGDGSASYEDVCCDTACFCNEAETNSTESDAPVCQGKLSPPPPMSPIQSAPFPGPPMTGFQAPVFGRYPNKVPGEAQANDEFMYHQRPPMAAQQPPQWH